MASKSVGEAEKAQINREEVDLLRDLCVYLADFCLTAQPRKCSHSEIIVGGWNRCTRDLARARKLSLVSSPANGLSKFCSVCKKRHIATENCCGSSKVSRSAS